MQRHRRGFTLIELMATLAVLGVALGLGIPAFRQILHASRVHAVFHELTTSLAMARITAMTRGVAVVVCPSQDGVTCRQDSTWDGGWITFPARSRHQAHPASSQDVLAHASSGGRGLAIRSTRHRARFQPTGLSEGNNLSLCIHAAEDGQPMGRIAVNTAGRIRSERTPSTAICVDSH